MAHLQSQGTYSPKIKIGLYDCQEIFRFAQNDNLSSASFTAITRVARHAGDSYSQFLLSFIILVELNHSLNALTEYIKVKILIG